MASSSSNNELYRLGYNKGTLNILEQRTAVTFAAHLLPFLKPTDRILDVGCGPGSITVGLAQAVHQGSVTAVDISEESLETARERIEGMKADGSLAPGKAGEIKLMQENVVEGLPFPDDSFDAIYSGQCIIHLTAPGHAALAVKEMWRVLKPGGVLATRNTSEYLFYPRHYNLTNIWSDKWVKMTVGHEASAAVLSGDEVPGLYRRAGFGADKIEYFNVVPLLYFGEEGRNFYHKTFCEKMRDAEFKSAWVNTGFTEVELEEATEALDRWAMDEDAWGVNLHNDLVWRK